MKIPTLISMKGGKGTRARHKDMKMSKICRNRKITEHKTGTIWNRKPDPHYSLLIILCFLFPSMKMYSKFRLEIARGKKLGKTGEGLIVKIFFCFAENIYLKKYVHTIHENGGNSDETGELKLEIARIRHNSNVHESFLGS